MMFCPACGQDYPDGAQVCRADRSVLRPKAGDSDPLLGQVLKGAYRVERRLAVGGMATVYAATQLELERTVAVKVLLPHLAPTPGFIERFYREAKILGRLCHPNIVSLIDCGQTPAGTIYIVTEFLEGRTLNEIIPAGRGLSFAQTVAVMTDLCGALAHAHAHGVVHRDLKPANIFVIDSPRTRPIFKILDFGVAKSLEKHGQQLTRAGAFVGTPGYMAPEQMKILGDVDARADVYALGALLYLMAAGRPAYTGDTAVEIVRKQVDELPELLDLASAGKPAEISAVIHKAMRAVPGERYGSVLDLLAALEHAADRTGEAAARAAIGEDDATLLDAEYSARVIAEVREGAKKPTGAADASTQLATLTTELRRERRISRLMALALAVAFAGVSYLGYRVVTTPQQTRVTEVSPQASPP